MAQAKAADVRRQEILDAAWELFRTKGYEDTSTTDILKKVGIAKGTLYYHFTSKEEILDAVIEQTGRGMIQKARAHAKEKEVPLLQRLLLVLSSLQARGAGQGEMLEVIHTPSNVLLHEKSQQFMLKEALPILTELLEEGIQEGLLSCAHPQETVEMILIYVLHRFDDQAKEEGGFPKELIDALIENCEKLLGTESGALGFMRRLFALEEGT